MKYENEITVEVNTDLDTLVKLLEDQGFQLKEIYDMNDIYMIKKGEEESDYLSMLSKCVLIRHLILENEDRKMITYKYKEYNDKKEITKQGKINVNVDDIEKTKELLEKIGFEELIRIKDHLLIYATDNEELTIQNVNDKHIYIEIEEGCFYANRTYNSIEEMKDVIKNNSIPIKGDNYFVKKAEIELEETYGRQRSRS